MAYETHRYEPYRHCLINVEGRTANAYDGQRGLITVRHVLERGGVYPDFPVCVTDGNGYKRVELPGHHEGDVVRIHYINPLTSRMYNVEATIYKDDELFALIPFNEMYLLYLVSFILKLLKQSNEKTLLYLLKNCKGVIPASGISGSPVVREDGIIGSLVSGFFEGQLPLAALCTHKGQLYVQLILTH